MGTELKNGETQSFLKIKHPFVTKGLKGPFLVDPTNNLYVSGSGSGNPYNHPDPTPTPQTKQNKKFVSGTCKKQNSFETFCDKISSRFIINTIRKQRRKSHRHGTHYSHLTTERRIKLDTIVNTVETLTLHRPHRYVTRQICPVARKTGP